MGNEVVQDGWPDAKTLSPCILYLTNIAQALTPLYDILSVHGDIIDQKLSKFPPL